MAIFKIGAKMFTLRVHSVDAPQPIPDDGFATATATSTSNRSSDFLERKGVPHLYRPIVDLSPSSSSPNPNPNRNPLLFVVAIPNYISSSDFIRFCEIDVVYISELVIIRNDALEDRYSALIKFEDQLRADAIFRRFNGKKFSFAEFAGTLPAGFTELHTCPVCLERLDQDTIGIQSTLCDHSFQCSCISKWTYLSCQVCRFCQQQEEKPTCSVCGTSTSENIWVCVICCFVGCGRLLMNTIGLLQPKWRHRGKIMSLSF